MHPHPARAARGGLLAGVLALAAVLAGCTAGVDGDGTARTSGATGSAAPSSAPGSSGATSVGTAGQPLPTPTDTVPALANSCGAYAAPDPDRPVVALEFTLAADHASVTGTERIAFTPDAGVDELVFRLTANTAPSVEQGNRVQVTSATADHGAGEATFDPAGADPGTQGGLLRIPFADTVPAGTTVTADLAFTVSLGAGAFDRFGRSGDYAWWGSAQPLLAWERGYGWHDEPLLEFTAESATSEAMATTLRVTAPADDVVVMSGNPLTAAGTGATRTWTGSLAAARDVAVAAGPFAVVDTEVDAGRPVALRVAAPDAAQAGDLVVQFRRALTGLAGVYGPFGFPSLAVARLPANGGGIEYPGAILMLDGSRRVAVHETAHQWFYAMVGNSQAQHAWLDEAFASFAEQRLDDDRPPASDLTRTGDVDTPTTDYGPDVGGYYGTTYDKGSAALFAARDAAGADAFDAAVACYVAHSAWTVADPADLQAALAGLPAALAVLRRAGALR